MVTRVDQQRALARAMGKGGRPMQPWVERDGTLRAAYDEGHAQATDKRAPEEVQPAPPRARKPDLTPAPEAVPEPEPADEGWSLSWPEAAQVARKLGISGEELPPSLAAHPRLRRAHKRARENADWCNPFDAIL